jgi:hypothetical protein
MSFSFTGPQNSQIVMESKQVEKALSGLLSAEVVHLVRVTP